MLTAFLLYNDGIATIIRMAAIFGAEIGIEPGHLIAALLLTQVAGIPCSFLFGRMAGWIGTKPAIFVTLGCYTGVGVLGYFMSTAAHFYALAILVGTVQGGSQALSRSLFATMVPRHKSSEFFGFFGVSEKFAGIIGPLVFAGVVALSGSSRGAVLSVIVFFVAGAMLLSRVDVAKGQCVARGDNESPGVRPEPEGRLLVRRFRPSDLRQIMPIEDATFPVDALRRSQFRRLSTAHPDEFLVAEISGAVVGYGAGSVKGDCGQLESVAVDQRLRGRGIGTALIQRLLERFQRIGLRRCLLQVRATNTRAIDLYTRLGFRVVGPLPAYYADGADALLMEATLPPRLP